MGEDIEEVFSSASCLIDPAIAAAGDVDTARTILRSPTGLLLSFVVLLIFVNEADGSYFYYEGAAARPRRGAQMGGAARGAPSSDSTARRSDSR